MASPMTILALALAVSVPLGANLAADAAAAPPRGAVAPVDAPLIPRAALFAPATRSRVALSPDGERLGWLEEGAFRWAPLDRLDAATTAELPAPPLGAWRWAFDGRHALLELADDGAPRVAALDVGTGAARWVTLADARLIALSPRHPYAIVVRRGDTLWRVELDDSRASERLFELDGAHAAHLDHELRVRVVERAVGEGDALDRVADDGARVEIARYDWLDARLAGVMSVSADGRRLYLVDNHERDTAALFAIDLETGARELQLADPQIDLLWAGATIDAHTGAPDAVVGYRETMRRHVLDASLVDDFAWLDSRIDGDVSFVGRSLDGRRWLVRRMGGGPLEYFLYERGDAPADRALRRVFGVVPALEGATLAARHGVVVTARDGLALPCHVYLPPGTDPDGDGVPEAPLPTVLYVHGGPWIGFEWNSWFTNRSLQLLANRGYAVVRTDFRAAMGYGRAFLDAGDRQWATGIQADLRDIGDAMVARGVADRERLAMWGWSFGGYSTMAQLAFAPEYLACGIAMYGVSDLLALSEHAHDAGWDHELWDRRVGDVHTEEGRAHLSAHSPLTAADAVVRPVLVTHGGRDVRSPPSQSTAFVDALLAREHPVTHLLYPDEPHDYRADESWISFWAVAEHFLAEHLGGRAEPYGDALEQAHFEVVTGAEHVPGLAAAPGG